MDIPEVADEASASLSGQPLQIPAQFAFTGRAIGILVGLAAGLAMESNSSIFLPPSACTFLDLDAGGIAELLRNPPNQALDTGRLLLRLPKALEQ